jgi:hypothetical protein
MTSANGEGGSIEMKGARLLKAILLLSAVLSLQGLAGCNSEVDPGTPEQLEKVRQQKIKQAERFQREG